MGKQQVTEKEIKQLKIKSAINVGMNLHILVDTENVDSTAYLDLRFLRKDDTLEIMYTRNSKKINYEAIKKISECNANTVYNRFEVIDPTKNLLDFKMVARGAELVVKSKKKFIIFISEDRGFDSAVDYINNNYNNRAIRLNSMMGLEPTLKDNKKVKENFDPLKI